MLCIALDAMGGDFGEKPIIKGLLQALKEREFRVILVGDSKKLKPLIPKAFDHLVEYEDAQDVFDMHESATDALKRKESSIYKAIDLARDKRACAVVSAGHSGATMSLATVRIGRIKGVLRPAIATLMPAPTAHTLVLDVGANVDCKPEYLFQFAVMADAYARVIMDIKSPRVALLSNGEEECKGNELVIKSHQLLKKLNSFVGNTEGKNIFDGSVDVVVCDGYTGNILLKTSEGVAGAITAFLKAEIKRSTLSKIGILLMKKSFKRLKNKIDYEEYGGAPLLGIDGSVIISHGKSGPKAIKNAIFQALDFANSGLNSHIEREISKYE